MGNHAQCALDLIGKAHRRVISLEDRCFSMFFFLCQVLFVGDYSII